MPELSLAEVVAALLALALNAYVLFGGADFGGGVWDMLASGPRRTRQREVIAHAIGPIWEANHVWLILVIVLSFTCFSPVWGFGIWPRKRPAFWAWRMTNSLKRGSGSGVGMPGI